MGRNHFLIAIGESEKKTQICTFLYLCSNSSNLNEILIKFKYASKNIH